jgi:hypothetical protein
MPQFKTNLLRIDENLLSEVRSLRRDVDALMQSPVGARTLEALAPEIGPLDYRVYDPTTGLVRMAISGTDLYDEFGVHANLIGFDNSLNPKVYIDATAGTIWAQDAVIAGTITATAGAIGGFSISATEIYSTHLKLDNPGEYLSLGATPPAAYGNNVGIFLEGANSGRLSIYKDANNYFQWDSTKLLIKAANFTLDASGNITASSATISGAITATSGAIGGWTIGASTLSSGSITLDSSVPAIKVGSATAYLTGSGIFMGLSSGVYKFHIGNPSGNYLSWDGTNLAASGQWIKSAGMDVALQDWNTNIVFSSASATQINWTSGTLRLSDGTTYSISSGNTGTMSALTYIYFDSAVSTTALQTTTTYSSAVGNGRILLGAAQNQTTGASVIPFSGQQPITDGSQLNALSILAGSIAAGAVTASKISVTSLSAITATMGSLTVDSTLTMSGSGSAIAIGTTPPASATSGTGLWIDRTGVYSLSASVQNATLTSSGLTAAAGSIVIDATGQTMTGLLLPIIHNATIGSEQRTGKIGAWAMADGVTIAYGLQYTDTTTSGGELVVNPGYETGTAIHHTQANGANGTWSIDTSQKHSGTYSAEYGNIVGTTNTGTDTTDRITVTALNAYAFSMWAYINKSTASVQLSVKWYDNTSGGSLLRTDIVGITTAQLTWTKITGSYLAPASAQSCEMIATCITGSSGGGGMWIDDFSCQLQTLTPRKLYFGPDLFLEGGALNLAEVSSPSSVISGFASITGDPSTHLPEAVDVNGRKMPLPAVGFLPWVFAMGANPAQTFGTNTNLAANGGAFAAAVVLSAPMLLRSVSVFNNNSSLQRSWNWYLYVQYTQTEVSSENSLTLKANGTAAEVFTPGSTSERTILAATLPTFLPPGAYWLVIQCQHASNNFGVAGIAEGTFSDATISQTKTLAIPPGNTLDFHAATWTKVGTTLGARLNGEVFGESAAF